VLLLLLMPDKGERERKHKRAKTATKHQSHFILGATFHILCLPFSSRGGDILLFRKRKVLPSLRPPHSPLALPLWLRSLSINAKPSHISPRVENLVIHVVEPTSMQMRRRLRIDLHAFPKGYFMAFPFFFKPASQRALEIGSFFFFFFLG